MCVPYAMAKQHLELNLLGGTASAPTTIKEETTNSYIAVSSAGVARGMVVLL